MSRANDCPTTNWWRTSPVAMPNWVNRTIWTGDNLPIMRGMNSESVDLIYLDPPFNSKTNYAAPIGSQAAGAEFKDTWSLQDVDVAWLDLIEAKHPQLNRVIHAAMTNSDKSYLVYMAVRLLEMRRLLKPTGAIYLHCDPTMSHYLKLVMDAIFGRKQFRNEIVWHYGQRTSYLPKHFSRKHDTILFYARDSSTSINRVPIEWKLEEFLARRHDVKTDGAGRQFVWSDGGAPGKRYKRMVEDVLKAGKPMDDVWDLPLLNSSARERVGYPTQKPLTLLERIVKASSNVNEVVLDPFCGCATACVAADALDRLWIGIDVSERAAQLVRQRIDDLTRKIVHRTDIPARTDIGKIPLYSSLDNKNQLYGEQGGDCNGCGTHFEKQNLEVDHIIARNQGGTDHIDNLQLLCGHCNRIKGDRGMEYLIAKLAA